jgi:hypothetical protein
MRAVLEAPPVPRPAGAADGQTDSAGDGPAMVTGAAAAATGRADAR